MKSKHANRSLLNILREKDYADPFSALFSLEKLLEDVDKITDNDRHTIDFIIFCNEINTEIQSLIFKEFNSLNISFDALIETLFMWFNSAFLNLTGTLSEHQTESRFINVESTHFEKITHQGNELNIYQAGILGGDILSELIWFAYEWQLKGEASTAPTTDSSTLSDLSFSRLWTLGNTLVNLKLSGYNLLLYQGSSVTIEGSTIRISSGRKEVSLLNSANDSRATNNIFESSIYIRELSKAHLLKYSGTDSVTVIDNVVLPKLGGNEHLSLNKSQADANIVVFQPHLINTKIKQLGNLSIPELSDILLLLTDIIQSTLKHIESKYPNINESEIPTKLNKQSLIDYLSQASKHSKTTIKKVIESLIAKDKKPFLWDHPFIEVGDNLLFSLVASIAPNHNLYYERWVEMIDMSFRDKEVNFKSILQRELRSYKGNFKFDLLNANKLKLDHNLFSNNIIIETQDHVILLEICIFNYPIEIPDNEKALNQLGYASIVVEDKARSLKQVLNIERFPIRMVITNYNHFSGLVINSVLISDLTLFKNYISVGSLRQGKLFLDNILTNSRKQHGISYYDNEQEFNQNFVSFFQKPLPVHTILDKLYFKEISILPNFLKTDVKIEIIERISEEDIINAQVENIDELVSYEYYFEPDKTESIKLDESITFTLSNLFIKIAYSSYKDHEARFNLYNVFSKAKTLGFAHLSFYILSTLEEIHNIPIFKSDKFEFTDYDTNEIDSLLTKIHKAQVGQLRISTYTINAGIVSIEEERKVVSFCLNLLSGLPPATLGSFEIENFITPLLILKGFDSRHNIYKEFYKAAGNIVEAFNLLHRYQLARDFCEEILIASIANNKHSHGWNLVFRCYTQQRSVYDAAFYGSVFLASLTSSTAIEYDLATEALFGAIKYFRNFGTSEFAKLVYETIPNFNLDEYDKQKITLTYFTTALTGKIEDNIPLLEAALSYLENKTEDIISFGSHGIIPWLALLYNIERILLTKQIKLNIDFTKLKTVLESKIDTSTVQSLKDKILVNGASSKNILVTALTNSYETRSAKDFVYEVQQLALTADALLQHSLISSDIDGLLLAGLVINDQSFSYDETYVNAGELAPIYREIDAKLQARLNNYSAFILSKISLKPKQHLVWLFNQADDIYSLTFNPNGSTSLELYANWKLSLSRAWLPNLDGFYFDSKQGKYNNSKKYRHYDFSAQNSDYELLKEDIKFTNTPNPDGCDEILLYTSMDISSFPHNLIMKDDDFMQVRLPVTNILTVERFIENSGDVHLTRDYSISAWIPADDQETTISWGIEILTPLLQKINARLYTSTYPTEPIKTDLNIFLAHGILDRTGFKAVYTNHSEGKVIAFPSAVFGTGKVAILFVCNSGSANSDFLSNSVVSFSGELLKFGYASVVAPFWSFDVTMSKIWLEEFLGVFNGGFSISESVWFANRKLAEYDEETSNMFYAPSGQLAMHLYGNPNVFVTAR